MNTRSSLKALLTGFLLVGVFVGFMLLVSLNLQWLLLLGVIIFAGAGYATIRDIKPPWMALLLLNAGQALFCFLVLNEIPGMSLMGFAFFGASVLGYVLRIYARPVIQVGSVAMLSIILFWGYNRIPKLVEDHLTNKEVIHSPDFSFTGLDQQVYSSGSFKDSVVVLSYFGTWCLPCIAELKELEILKKEFDSRPVRFLAVNTGQGGDDLEKVIRFSKKHGFDFDYAFEPDGASHQAFGFTGVPATVIIDRSAMVRLRHEGYNASENYRGLIADQLNELLR